MADLISRLDKFVIQLLDEAEAVTSGATEDTPDSPPARATLTERVQVLKAAIGYLGLRNRLTENTDGEETPTGEEPVIVGFERRIRERGKGRR